ncbi:type VI secretion system tip protein TssI/VgrG [uncultured Desulfobacter sp.]|uniref:type VI secretion system tip protein TssI/VgrG n=1 Tax=uncultured Desulfobacter sp. TaxID=240139 RepID=UPI002AABC68E|nr:type VI secretion system tip protein TssI/VgrG [uncultured Desulfobacter sp.]
MKYLTQQKFSFICDALDEATFGVVMFKGFEALSRPFEFDIMLVTDEPDVDMDAAMNHTARFSIHGTDEKDVTVRGVLSGFEQLHQTGPYFFYRAVLVPRLWWLTLNRNNQVFIDHCLDDIISRLLKGVRIFQGIGFDFNLKSPCTKKEYVCQYGESHFNFISRWLEHDGLYYFFDQTENGEKIIFTDANICHADLKIHPSLSYQPASGQETLRMEHTLTSLSCRRRQLPHDILLKDYNYERPSMNVEGRAVVDENGRGSVYTYGEHFFTSEEGDALARIRADELRCRKKEFFCESSVPDVTPGYTFRLTNHFTQAFNQKYLIVEVMHQGSQTGYLISGIQKALAHLEQEVAYRNSFTAIPADVQFRAQRKTARPLMPGTLHATVDASGSGDYAELDAKGRYKIRLPFDIHSSHMDAKASCFIRMLQPHAGPPVTDQSRGPLPSGFHLPLRKNTEVLLTFINGDPDRPVIAGAVPNPLTRSTVDENNQTRNIFRDHFGNEMIFDSTPGDEHIRLYSPHHNSGWELGRSEKQWTDSDKTALLLGNSLKAGFGSDTSFTGGFGIDVLGGARIGGTMGAEHNVLAGASHNWTLGYRWEWSKGPFVQSTSKDAMITAREDIILGAGDEFCLAAGTQRPKEDSNYDIDNKNKSVIRATRKGITLSLGACLGETAEGNGKAHWFYPTETSKIEDDTKWALANGVSLIAFAGSMAGLLESIRKNSKGGEAVSGIAMTIFMLTAAITAKHLHRNNLSDSMIEPATHKEPSQKIWMYEDGTIGIVSTKGQNEPDKKAKIIIGVNEQIDGEPDSQFFYNAQNEVNSAPVKSKFKDFLGLESPNKPIVTNSCKKLGQGSNIIIKKDWIDIREGGTDPEAKPDSQILVKGNGVEIKVNDEQENTSYISIAKSSGNIFLNNTATNEGKISLFSKDKISLTSGAGRNIELTATGNGEITFQSSSVNVKAKIIHRNLEVQL